MSKRLRFKGEKESIKKKKKSIKSVEQQETVEQEPWTKLLDLSQIQGISYK